MPKLWTDTIEAHRETVADAIFSAAAKLIAHGGFSDLSMSRIAKEAGIGRATLYKYFRDLDELLLAWHRRTVEQHLTMLEQVAAEQGDPVQALEAVLLAYAEIRRGHRDHAAATMLHSLPHLREAEHRLHDVLAKYITAGRELGSVRNDIPVSELAGFALAAIRAVESGASRATAQRTARMVLHAFRP